MGTFRHFMKSHSVGWSLLEQDSAAPPVGVPDAPDSPGSTTNKYHFDTIGREMGMEDDDLNTALEDGIITIWKVPKYGWGFRVTPPVQAQVEKQDDGNYAVTFMLVQKKLMSPKSFIMGYKQGQNPLYFNGEIEDKTETMTAEELQDAMVEPFAGGAMGGPMGSPPGGPPGMGGPMGGM